MYTFFLNTKHGFFQGDLHIYSALQKYSYAFIFFPHVLPYVKLL